MPHAMNGALSEPPVLWHSKQAYVAGDLNQTIHL